MMYTIIHADAYEWDDEKLLRNLIKHGIGFEAASAVFADPCLLILDDDAHSRAETRHWAIGDAGSQTMVVVFTVRLPGARVRIISARKAKRRERRHYEQSKRIRLFEGPPGHS